MDLVGSRKRRRKQPRTFGSFAWFNCIFELGILEIVVCGESWRLLVIHLVSVSTLNKLELEFPMDVVIKYEPRISPSALFSLLFCFDLVV